MATGRLPYRAASMPELIGQMLQTTPVAPAALNPDVPAGASDAILSAVSGSAAARAVSARDLADALAR
jgi:hypothetical protein